VASLLVVAAFLLVLDFSRPHVGGDTLNANQLVRAAEDGRLRDASILDIDSYVVGTYVRADGSLGPYNSAYLKEADARSALLELLLQNEVPTTIDQQTIKGLVRLALFVLPSLLILLLFVYLIVSYRRGSGPFSIRSGARRVDAADNRVTFADVAGQDAAIEELREVSQFLSDPGRFASVGARIPKGVLLYGPPGCGKTLMARALAGEAGARFYSISGSDFMEMYVGVGAARVRDLFREARQNAPAIVFIDELDSIGRARGMGNIVTTGEHEQSLNQVLAEMDGFSVSDGVIVIGATNRPDVLDRALLRPGRFDRTIGLELPDESARLAILRVHARGKRLGPDADLEGIAERGIGLTGADLANVMNEAALLAGRAGLGSISQAELEAALQRTLEAPERQRRLSMRERSIGRRFVGQDRVTFAEVAGVDEAVEELAEIKEFLVNRERFSRLGARVPRGILLVGPPGCGKTLLARAVAGETNAAFFSAAASEFVEMFVGVGASRIRDLFAEARAVAPSIVFIDEIDTLGAHRTTVATGGGQEAAQTLNQFLVELDGFDPNSGVIVMGATNRPDRLDQALLRPGRFDRQIVVDLPDRRGRRAILDIHVRDVPLGPDVDLDRMAAVTTGLSGAELANVVNEAALLAARRGLERVSMELLDEGIDRARLGIAGRVMLNPEERRAVAVHEVGHALVARTLPGGDPPHRVTIHSRGHMLGATWVAPEADSMLRTRSTLLDQMAAMLGGRAAEDIVYGDLSDGARSDLARATELARTMVCQLGMSDRVGPMAFPDYVEGVGPNGAPPRAFSEETARLIDEEVRALIDEAYGRAVAVLRAHRQDLERVVEALVERETLSGPYLDELLGRPAVRREEAPARPPSR
jgi:cell division protease FtsH